MTTVLSKHQRRQSNELKRQQQLSNNNNTSTEYTLMDRVSCSSDSFSHLAVPQPCKYFYFKNN